VRNNVAHLTNANLSFHVYDPTSKRVAYCWFIADYTGTNDQLVEAAEKDKIISHQVGVGGHSSLLTTTKPLDLKGLDGAKGALSLARNGDPGEMTGTATLMLDNPAVVLSFSIVADFSYGFPARQRGFVFKVRIVKTSTPKLPKDYTQVTEGSF